MTHRLGFISVHDPSDRAALSGMPFAMSRALEDEGFELVPVFPAAAAGRGGRIRALARRVVPRRVRGWARSDRAPAVAKVEGESILEAAAALARELDEQLAGVEVDALFGCCVSVPLYRMRTELPIFYFSDTTAELVNSTYPEFMEQSEAYRAACDLMERTAIQRARSVIFATGLARRSAIQTYGARPESTHVVPLGVNAVSLGTADLPYPEPPTRAALRLVMTAADPVRKRSDLAVAVTEELARRGWNATLDLIGHSTPRARASAVVRDVGWLDPSNRRHARQLRDLVAASHMMILPSVGEAFGMAPGEAAHAGRTSIVSAAGGLPEAVLDGETGVVMPVDATADRYADAIEALADDPDRYRRMCVAARERAQRELTWGHWGRRVAEHIRTALAEGRAGEVGPDRGVE